MRSSSFVLLLLVTMAGCGSREEVLVADYVFAQRGRDDIYGRHIGADRGLHAFVEGWEQPQATGLWATGGRSSISLTLPGRRASLHLVLSTPRMLADHGQQVEVHIEGIPVGTLELSAQPDTVDLALPDDAWQPGPVRLDFVASTQDTWTKSRRTFLLREMQVRSELDASEREQWSTWMATPPTDPAWGVVTVPAADENAVPPAEAPDLLLLLADTSRADHHSCYGYPRPTSPTLDSLATAGVRLTQVISDASYTVCAVPSLMTGRSWREHRVEDLKDALSDDFVTLAEVLHDQGYATFAVSHNPNVSFGMNHDQGFDEFYEVWALPEEWKARKQRDYWPELAEERFVARLEEGLPDRPVFFYVHTMFPHAPYFPLPAHDLWRPEGDRGKIVGSLAELEAFDKGELPAEGPAYERFVSLYDGSIHRGDASLARMLDAWRGMRRSRPLLVVFVSDHGEGLGEHGRFDHGNTPYDEATHVPVVFSPASMVEGLAPSASRLRSLSDVMPMVLHYLHAQLPADTSWPRRFLDVFADPRLERTEVFIRCMKPLYGLRTPHSLTVFDGWRQEYYDLTVDPAQRTNARIEAADAFLTQRTRLRAFLENEARPFAPSSAELSPADIERLKALGYL